MTTEERAATLRELGYAVQELENRAMRFAEARYGDGQIAYDRMKAQPPQEDRPMMTEERAATLRELGYAVQELENRAMRFAEARYGDGQIAYDRMKAQPPQEDRPMMTEERAATLRELGEGRGAMRHSDDHRPEVLAMVDQELRRQRVKWGQDRNLHPTLWALVLGEEVGEVSEAILKGERENYPRELVQVAAVAIAAVEDWLFQAVVRDDHERGEGARLPKPQWEPHLWSGLEERTAG